MTNKLNVSLSTEEKLTEFGPTKPSEVKSIDDIPPHWIVQPKLKGMSGLLSPDGRVYTGKMNFCSRFYPNPFKRWVQGEIYSTQVDQWDIVGAFHSSIWHPEAQFWAFDIVDERKVQISRNYELDMGNWQFKTVPHVLHSTRNINVLSDIFSEAFAIPASDLEGLIFRDPDVVYQYGRTKSVLKLKFYKEMDCEVLGKVEGNGKRKGMLGAFICVSAENGEPFQCGGGKGLTNDKLRSLWENPSPKRIKVRYEALKNGTPQCPQFMEVIP